MCLEHVCNGPSCCIAPKFGLAYACVASVGPSPLGCAALPVTSLSLRPRRKQARSPLATGFTGSPDTECLLAAGEAVTDSGCRGAGVPNLRCESDLQMRQSVVVERAEGHCLGGVGRSGPPDARFVRHGGPDTIGNGSAVALL